MDGKKQMAARNRQDAQELIDIGQEIIDLYAGERTLAFFDFGLERPGKESLVGLCRIAQPKDHTATLSYLSLSFLVDTPDAASRTAVREALSAVAGETLKAAIPEITDLVSGPSQMAGSESYMVQMDLLLEGGADERSILTQLVPAIARLAQLQTTRLEWWKESPLPTIAPIPARPDPPWLGTVRDWLKRSLDRPSAP